MNHAMRSGFAGREEGGAEELLFIGHQVLVLERLHRPPSCMMDVSLTYPTEPPKGTGQPWNLRVTTQCPLTPVPA